MGSPLRRGNVNKLPAWLYAARSIGAESLHFHPEMVKAQRRDHRPDLGLHTRSG